jgi:hypothetical protein
MIKTRSGREIILPTTEEDATINAAALSDPDAQPLSDAELARLRPVPGSQILPAPKVSVRPELFEESYVGGAEKINTPGAQATVSRKI